MRSLLLLALNAAGLLSQAGDWNLVPGINPGQTTHVHMLDGRLQRGGFISATDSNIVIRQRSGAQTFTKGQIKKIAFARPPSVGATPPLAPAPPHPPITARAAASCPASADPDSLSASAPLSPSSAAAWAPSSRATTPSIAHPANSRSYSASSSTFAASAGASNASSAAASRTSDVPNTARESESTTAADSRTPTSMTAGRR